MAEALRILGYNVYDFLENYEYLGDKWMKIFKEGGTKEDFYEMYKDVDAVTDIPAFFFWKEILEAFPDAKIVFCERPEQEWYKSFIKQKESSEKLIYYLLKWSSQTNYHFNAYKEAMILAVYGIRKETSFFGKYPENELLIKHAYRRHNAYVKNCAPKNQFINFNINDGWEPLCKFLNVSFPETEFPHKNKKGSITQVQMDTNKTFKKMKVEMGVNLSILAALTAFCVYRAFKYF